GNLYGLGLVARKQGDMPAAEDYLARSWAIVRDKRLTVTGDEAGRAFARAHADRAADLVSVRLARGKSVEAFRALADGRAQVLLQRVSERKLTRTGVDPEQWRRYEAAERAFLKAGKELASAGEKEAELEHEIAEQGGPAAEQTREETKRADLSKAKTNRDAA